MDQPVERAIDAPEMVRVKRIEAGSLFSLIAAAVFSLFVPLILFGGVLAFFGVSSIGLGAIHLRFGNVGLPGLLSALVTAPIFSLVVSVAVWIVLYAAFSFGVFPDRLPSNMSRLRNKGPNQALRRMAPFLGETEAMSHEEGGRRGNVVPSTPAAGRHRSRGKRIINFQ
jgi:hypothetical protein